MSTTRFSGRPWRLFLSGAVGGALALALAGSPTVAAAGGETPPAFALAWGGTGVKAGNLMAPRGVAADKDGHIFVPDRSGRLQKFGPDGKQITEWGGSGDFERLFQEPAAVALDAAGLAYVVDTAMIRKYDASGDPVERWMAPESQGIAITPSGAFYATDARKQRVVKFDGPGKPKLVFGKPGTAPGDFNMPTGIAIDAKGNLYVAEAGNHRVQKLAADGKFILQWGGQGSAAGQFDTPEGVALDKAGNVYVVDQKNARVQKFSPEGKFILQWGTPGAGNGEFNSPTGIAVDKHGNIYVADTGNNRIQKFSPQ